MAPELPMVRILVLSLLTLASCTSWKPVARHERWTLYELPGQAVAARQFAEAFDPAFEAVEVTLGSFERRVDVHAWPESGGPGGDGSRVGTGVHQVPGIGPARIQAYHARGGSAFGRSGVFIGAPDAGTAVHELVHARFAELGTELPLWFEEGIAGVLGDGILVDGLWYVDGLACWPLRELGEELLSDENLARLIALDASEETSVRDNVLVHFVGWAVVFDLYRESGASIEWRSWLAAFGDDPLPEVRRRMERTLSAATPLAWIDRLESEDRGVRLATAKGLWKLRSREVLDALLTALERESDPEVRIGLAVNILATAGELTLPWRRWREVEIAVREALRSADLDDAREQRAALDLYRAYRRGEPEGDPERSLERLSRFWEE